MEIEKTKNPEEELERLLKLINSPELYNFSEGIVLESVYQKEHWGEDHDSRKSPEDWYWTLSYLAGKALRAHIDGDYDKALHHTISSAALLANWHESIKNEKPL